MATINYTVDRNVEAGYVKVEWAHLTANDDGQPFDCNGLGLGSIHYFGDFNNNTAFMFIKASNEVVAANWHELIFSQTPRMQLLTDGRYLGVFGSIKPVADSNMVDAGVSLIFVPRA